MIYIFNWGFEFVFHTNVAFALFLFEFVKSIQSMRRNIEIELMLFWVTIYLVVPKLNSIFVMS